MFTTKQRVITQYSPPTPTLRSKRSVVFLLTNSLAGDVGIGHRSRAGALARDPASRTYVRSGFRLLNLTQQKSKYRSRSYAILILRAM